MALSNGVLVHGPTAWACAVRTDDGEIKVASGAQAAARAGVIQQPFLRGPLRLAEAFALLPELRRRLPEARLPFERPGRARRHGRERGDGPGRAPLRPVSARPRASCSRARSRSRPALLALRGGELAAYHGAEHVSIGTYEHGEPRAKEHERCGSHLIGPLLAATAAGNVLAVAGSGAPPRHGARRRRRSARSARRSRSSAG